MSVAAAAAALRDADEALSAARIIRDARHEELIAACCADGWKVLFRLKEGGNTRERVVLEHFHGGSADLTDIVAREAATA